MAISTSCIKRKRTATLRRPCKPGCRLDLRVSASAPADLAAGVNAWRLRAASRSSRPRSRTADSGRCTPTVAATASRPHALQVFKDGYRRSTFSKAVPYQAHWCSSRRTNSAMPALPRAHPSLQLRCIPALCRVSHLRRAAALGDYRGGPVVVVAQTGDTGMLPSVPGRASRRLDVRWVPCTFHKGCERADGAVPVVWQEDWTGTQATRRTLPGNSAARQIVFDDSSSYR